MPSPLPTMDSSDAHDPDAASTTPGAQADAEAPVNGPPADSAPANGAPCKAMAYWVENDGLLRDEGVLFGYAAFHMGEDAQMLDAKLASIAAAYAPCAGREREALASLADERDRLAAARDAALADEAEQTALSRTVHTPEHDPYEPAAAHQRLRVALPGVLAFGGAVALGWMVYDLLVRSGLSHPLAAAVALTALGSAGSFQPISVLHARHDVLRGRDDHAEMWKLHVAEWLLPLVAAVLVGVFARRGFDLATVVAASAFLFVAFAFVGRMLSGTLTRFAIARRRGREEAEKARRASETTADAAARAATLRTDVQASTQRLDALDAEVAAARQRLSAVEGTVAYKQSLFVSEYRFGLWVMRSRAASGDGHASAHAAPDYGADYDAAFDPAPGDGGAASAPGEPPPRAGFVVDDDGTASPFS